MTRRSQLLTDIDFQKTPEALGHLQSERKRTGAGVKQLMAAFPPPQDTNETRLSQILRGHYRYASKSEYNYLIQAYSKLPGRS